MTDDIMTGDLGKTAFDAYRTHVGGRAYDGEPMPTWEDVPEELLVRGGWRAAAVAVLDEYRAERESMHNDLGELLRAVGMFDGASPRSSHDLMCEAIVKVRELAGRVKVLQWGEFASVSVTCSRCGRPLSPSAPAGQVFVLADHDCPVPQPVRVEHGGPPA